MKIAIAQTAPILGDVQANLNHMLQLMKQYSSKVELIVFPELSLTGYILKEKLYDVAISTESNVMKQICKASIDLQVQVMFGFVELGEGDLIYNSAAFIKEGQVSMVHRKVYPTNYGMFEELKYFAKGKKVKTDTVGEFTTSMLICNDMWHPSLAHIAAHQHTSLLVGLVNSPEGGIGSEVDSSIGWERVGLYYATVYGCYVLLVNRVGSEEGVSFYGQSKVIDPYGEIIAKCPYGEESVQVCEIDSNKVKQMKQMLPIIRDEDKHVTLHHLQQIAKSQYV